MKKLFWLSAAAALVLGFSPILRADLAPDNEPAQARQERMQRRIERLRERAASLASGLALPSGSALQATPPAPSSSATLAPGAALREELARKWAELAATRLERRERHRATLIKDVGPRLSDPVVQDELRLHSTRLAELSRAEFLAQNARSGAAREQLLARVTKLSSREAARHRKQMAKLLAAPPQAAASPSAGPAASAEARP
jgi:hypothetical protein